MTQTEALHNLLSDGLPHRTWKPIRSYEDVYFVSDDGILARCFKNGKTTVVAQAINRGYKRVCLSKNNVRRNFSVHRLVAQAFIRNPSKKPCINHKDGNKFNNAVQNLEWSTYSENNAHAYRNGLKTASGEKNGQSKLKLADVIEIRRLKLPHLVIAKLFHISENHVGAVKAGRRWKLAA
jgi:hypothetical protein